MTGANGGPATTHPSQPAGAADNRRLRPAGALFRNDFFRNDLTMARWPRHFWTTLFTYGIIFIGFPVLCWLAYRWVRGE